MHKYTIAGLALIATALGAGVAQAADLPRQMYTKAPPAIAPVFDWTGFYIGANVGYGSAHADLTVGGITGSENLTGVIGGGQIGYNWQTGPWVFGLEADFQGSDQHANFAGGGVTESDSVPWFGTFRGRIGYAVAPMWMLYVTGGGAVMDFKSNVTVAGVGSATFETSHAGWTIGAGVEGAITRNWSWKAEYLHIDTGNFNTTLLGVVPATFRMTDDIGRFGINYRF
jgi:outer membrane immunogenic protein